MDKYNFDQAEVAELKDAEMEQVEGGGPTPWDSIISNLGEIVDTCAGFIDGLLGRAPQKR